MKSEIDEIFRSQNHIETDFVFDQQVARVFEDMIARSIPFYNENNEMIIDLLRKHIRSEDLVYDLGCSTGFFLRKCLEKIPGSVRFKGVDNSQSMLDEAQRKLKDYKNEKGSNHHFEFIMEDLTQLNLEPCQAIVMNYTLQFIRPLQREELMRKIYSSLKSEGLLILSEKVLSPDPYLNRQFIDLYYDYKKEKGYSQIEISKKREALENVLVPYSIEENLSLLKKAGFRHVDTFFQWFNFCSFVAIR